MKNKSPTTVLGLIGGIGSGKSLVAQELARLGGWLISADQLGHEVLKLLDVQRQVVARFGPDIVDPQGVIDRKKLGARVFADGQELRALQAIVFPHIGRRIQEEMEQAQRRSDHRFIVLDAAVMLEAGWHDVCDHLVFVDAPREVRLARVQQHRGWSEAELQAREAMQLPLEEKRRRADAMIDNGGPRAALAAQVDGLMRQWNL